MPLLRIQVHRGHPENELFFRIRLWGRAEIIAALLQVYGRLREEMRAELPLRQVWTLVLDEEDD
jgi:restriction system protein